MEKLNFIFDLEYVIKPAWFSIIIFIIYYSFLRNKLKEFFINFFVSDDANAYKENKTVNNLFILIEIAFLTIYIFAIWDLMLVNKNVKDFGQWGDFFGGVVNPILTFITFIALLITIVLQQIELKESREEFKKSADALTKQEEHIELQTFENTFFKMVELHNNIVDNLNYEVYTNPVEYFDNKVPKIEIRGRKVFERVFDDIFIPEENPITFDNIIYRYYDFEVSKNYILGHYFRNLYMILKFLQNKKSQLGENNINNYSEIIKAQLSSLELILLFIKTSFNLSENKEFRKLLIDFSFFQNMPIISINKVKYSSEFCNMKFFNEINNLENITSSNCLEMYILKDKFVMIPENIFCLYFENGKSAFDGNEVVEKIKPYLECNK